MSLWRILDNCYHISGPRTKYFISKLKAMLLAYMAQRTLGRLIQRVLNNKAFGLDRDLLTHCNCFFEALNIIGLFFSWLWLSSRNVSPELKDSPETKIIHSYASRPVDWKWFDISAVWKNDFLRIRLVHLMMNSRGTIHTSERHVLAKDVEIWDWMSPFF